MRRLVTALEATASSSGKNAHKPNTVHRPRFWASAGDTSTPLGRRGTVQKALVENAAVWCRCLERRRILRPRSRCGAGCAVSFTTAGKQNGSTSACIHLRACHHRHHLMSSATFTRAIDAADCDFNSSPARPIDFSKTPTMPGVL